MPSYLSSTVSNTLGPHSSLHIFPSLEQLIVQEIKQSAISFIKILTELSQLLKSKLSKLHPLLHSFFASSHLFWQLATSDGSLLILHNLINAKSGWKPL